MFDIYIYPFGFKNQKEYSNLTGYFVGNVQRKATRTRVEDIIVIRFTPFRNLSIEQTNAVNNLVSSTAENYYKTKGPITTAAKSSGDFFNNGLTQINIKNNSQAPIVGSLHFLILNKDNLFFMQSGGSISYYLTKSRIEKFEDNTYGVDGIGIAKSIKLRFYHATLNETDRVILAAKPPKSWTLETILSDQRLSISHLRRKLIELSQEDFEAIIIQFRKGNGSIHQLKLESEEFSQEESEDRKVQAEDLEAGTEEIDDFNNGITSEELSSDDGLEEQYPHVSDDQEVTIEEEALNPASGSINFDEFTFEDKKLDQEPLDIFLEGVKNTTIDDAIPTQNDPQEGIYLTGDKWEGEETLPSEERDKRKEKQSSKAFALFLLRIRNFFQKINRKNLGFKKKVKKSLFNSSDPSNELNTLSFTSMLMIAVLVAVFVSAIGITVYLRSGISSQKTELIANANILINDALEETNVNNKILMLQEALRLIHESENFGGTNSNEEVKTFIQAQLDDLLDVTRIDIQTSIIGGLDRRIQVSRMGINTNGDVYSLDSGTGRVIRMIATRPDYVIDTSFVCGPGKYGDVLVDSLVDIEPVNYANKLNTTVMGIDSHGNLLMCIPGNDPVGVKLSNSDMIWGEIKAIGFNGYSLFVLDAGELTRDIYEFPVSDYAFDKVSESLFNGNIPDNLAGSLDIAVNQGELYLLHENGQLTRCNLDQYTCENNVGYGIISTDQTRENVDTIQDSHFIQMYITLPPDPSLYFLDETNQSIYHFSMALNLQKQIRPNIENISNFDATQPLSAFAVSANGILQFAYSNQVYFGYLP